MKWNCLYCGKKHDAIPSIAKKRKYCNTSHQIKYEYDNGIRNKVTVGNKARKVAHKKIKKSNWLNSDESRRNLKKALNTKESRLKSRNAKLGEKNPMYGKKGSEAGHYCGGSKRKYGASDRGFDWFNLKHSIKKRDNYRCQKCFVREEDLKQHLQVHHIVPYKIFEDNSPDNLITVCSKCHAMIEPSYLRVKSVKKVNKKIKVYNFSVEDDETYVAEDIIVHNCRSSIQGITLSNN